ncbi:hypothetical protein K388_07467 [Streptomyces sp. KhCrAH-43]|uniref:hypothetical protein n=1 Tax=unclassified Streptomyces TaxID=2593676 RepID=UPI000378F447|nr:MULTISPECIES: hypothetical protein [unclassified Streptomyces]MYS35959.1 hypothetical protein [Streptomyces sp. SID4920]MYX70940.1 hypothetical protein [Streptomyces sp. SID8373]RAJ42595.1 hypothetical protein K388_07467 [Streptomyces sp. KhCrAH-43]
MTVMLTTDRIATQLRETIEATPGYWTGGCANPDCTTTACEYVVADEYYASYEAARADGVEWGMRICRSCKRNLWNDALVLLEREPEAVALPRCEFSATTGCDLSAKYFVQLSGERKWYCAHDVALYVRAGFDVYRIDKQGRIIHASEKLSEIFNG